MPDKTQIKQASIVFSPSGKRGSVPVGTPVLQAARELGVDIDSICGGHARCGRCQVEPLDGEFAREGMVSSGSHLSDLTEDERYCLQNERLATGNRLSCRARILGDIKIDIPPGSQVHQQVVRKDFEARHIEIDPLTRLYFTSVAEPDLQYPDGDLQRLLSALEHDWGLSGLDCDIHVLQTLQSALRAGEWQVTVAIRDKSRIVAIWPGLRDHLYGAAIDVGSTTIAVHLCDLSSGEVLASAGTMNPQIRFGEDLMSRVSYAMLHTQGAAQMTSAVRSAINELLTNVIEKAAVDKQQVLEITLVGNPVMHHLLLGLDPTPLGASPFALAIDSATEVAASDLDLHLAEGTRAYLLPCIAGHVGADTAAVMLAEAPWERDEINLIIDVGTNAEIILGNHKRLLAASSPTGPAFEGAQISSGQRAAPGAIERVRIDPVSLEPRFKIIGNDLWSDDPGFEEALYAGTRLLMDHLGVDHVDRIRLAGAFGSHIDVKYAMVLGLLPDCDLKQVSSADNAASTGARIALLNRASRREIETRVRKVEKIETAIDESFQQHFVEALGIPHARNDYPILSAIIQLPKPGAAKSLSRRKRRLRKATTD